jgi:hypothetical protein
MVKKSQNAFGSECYHCHSLTNGAANKDTIPLGSVVMKKGCRVSVSDSSEVGAVGSLPRSLNLSNSCFNESAACVAIFTRVLN